MFAQPDVRSHPLRHIDPRSRVALAALLSVCVALCRSLPACLCGLGLGLLLLAMTCPRPAWLLRRLAGVNLFVAFLWCVVPWTSPGMPVWHLGPLTASAEGIDLCLLVSVKANAIVCIVLALVANMDVAALGRALRGLGCPETLVWLFLLMSRYIHTLAEEWRRLDVAARLRCFRPRTDLHTWRTLASLLGLLLVRSDERACRVREAMLLRGFNGQFHSLDTFHWRTRDTLFSLALTLCAAFLLWTDLGGFHAA